MTIHLAWHMKRCSTSLTIRERNVKATWTLLGWLPQKKEITKADMDMKKKHLFCTVGKNCCKVVSPGRDRDVHLWAFNGCGCLHNTCTRSNLFTFQHGWEKCSKSPTPSWRATSHPSLLWKKSLFFEDVSPGMVHPPVDSLIWQIFIGLWAI